MVHLIPKLTYVRVWARTALNVRVSSRTFAIVCHASSGMGLGALQPCITSSRLRLSAWTGGYYVGKTVLRDPLDPAFMVNARRPTGSGVGLHGVNHRRRLSDQDHTESPYPSTSSSGRRHGPGQDRSCGAPGHYPVETPDGSQQKARHGGPAPLPTTLGQLAPLSTSCTRSSN